MSGQVEGKVAFITGAARGQGRSHAITLAREGADIIAVDACTDFETVSYPMATSEDLAVTVKEVEALGRKIIAAPVDVRDYTALAGVVDDAVSQLGRLDIVSANAGVASVASLDEMSETIWQEMIDINLTGVWHTVKAAIPHIRAGGSGGSMILTSSGAGLKAFDGYGHYVAAKHGVIGLMRTLALELAKDKIRVNSVLPTNTNTDMIHNPMNYKLFRPDLDEVTPEQFREASDNAMTIFPDVPWMEPEDISNAILFLASDSARYITGVALPVDCGFLIK